MRSLERSGGPILVSMAEAGEAPARTLRAAVFALLAVVLLLALRAKSDGDQPGWPVILASFGLVTALARPLTARERGLPVVFAGLLGAQFALHVGFLFASTGQLAHAGGAGLVCSPATTVPGGGCLPAERGGALLLSVQLVVAALFACWARGAESVSWQLARAQLAALLAFVRRLARARSNALVIATPVVDFSLSPQGKTVPLPRPARFAREHRRRGPPRRRRSDSSSIPSVSTPLALSW